jgi:hypothetical protein
VRVSGVVAMSDPKPEDSRPSLWAVALLVFSAVFAVVSMALVSASFGAF